MNSSQSPIKHDGVRALMERRLELGEFGTPPDMAKYHDELFKILEQGHKTVYHQVCPLWTKEGLNNPSTKVVFECHKTRDPLIIPPVVHVLGRNTRKTNDTPTESTFL